MRWWTWFGGFIAASAATLLYGALSEANKLVVERRTLRLKGWPAKLDGYRIGVLADFHLRDEFTVEHAKRAVSAVIGELPDIVVFVGDFVGYWKSESPWLLEEALAGLAPMAGKVLAIPGNHDYWNGDASLLTPVLAELGIRLLRNEVWDQDGICWVGIDSMNAITADPFTPMMQANPPCVVLWHEPDAVEFLPEGANLMIAGHSHGGQFRFPWGWIPKKTIHGEKYIEGFYPDARTPLYVSRGLSTTGPPSRLGALPEVSVLTMRPYSKY